MRVRLQRSEDSLTLHIPQAFADETGLDANSDVELLVENSQLVIRPMSTPRYELADLIAQVTADNLHDEIDTSNPVGKEVW